MNASRRLGVLGGTFDPIHFGHLDAADAARTALTLDDVLFIPAHDPPHKAVEPRASACHRFALVSLALQDRPSYRVSDMEIARQGTSYTADTLRALHECGWHGWQIFFILGADAFAEIATWHEFPAVLDLAHFVVVARPGTTSLSLVTRPPTLQSRARDVGDACHGEDRSTGIFLVEAVTRDVSSTTIRERIADGRSIDDLVPMAVARHMVAHHLYGAVDELHGEPRSSEGA
jgi:nicotinate-nucleotide adenylyltransferase